ncbi:hypothetical protein JXL19_05915, partial [bacterium]|nr:hypothetical protein [bacterium]
KDLPEYVNTLHYFSLGYGYWIKMNKDGYLIMQGQPATVDISLNLKTGWSLMGYIPPDTCYAKDPNAQANICPYSEGIYQQEEGIAFFPVDPFPQTPLVSISGKYQRVTSFDTCDGAKLWDKDLPDFVNTLDYMGPKYGYWIKMNEDGYLISGSFDFSRYLPTDPKEYGQKTFEYTYGGTGQFTSEIIGIETVPYTYGEITGAKITGFWEDQYNVLIYNDGVNVKFLGLEDYYLSTDCSLTDHHPKWAFNALRDGMIIDQGSYCFVKNDMSDCQTESNQMLLFSIQDITVLNGHYKNAVVLWWLDKSYQFTPLNSHGKETGLGIVLPNASETKGYSVTAIDIYGFDAGPIAFGDVDASSGSLQKFCELSSGQSPFWPLEVGQWYEYTRSDSIGNTWTVIRMIDSKVTLDSLDWFHLVTWNYDDDLTVDDAGYIRSTGCALYGYNPEGEDYLAFQMGPIGTKWIYYEAHGSGFNYKVTEVVEIGPVTVPNGFFEKAYVYRKYRCADPYDLSKGKSPYWFEYVVPGIGIVKEVDYWVGNAPNVMEMKRKGSKSNVAGDFMQVCYRYHSESVPWTCLSRVTMDGNGHNTYEELFVSDGYPGYSNESGFHWIDPDGMLIGFDGTEVGRGMINAGNNLYVYIDANISEGDISKDIAISIGIMTSSGKTVGSLNGEYISCEYEYDYDEGSTWSAFGIATFYGNGNGTYQGLFTPDGSPGSAIFTYTVDPNGIITLTRSDGLLLGRGMISADDSIMTLVDTDSSQGEDIGIKICVKKSSGMSNASLNGEYYYGDVGHIWTCFSTLNFDGNGNGTFQNHFASDNCPEIGTFTFTYNVSPDGTFTALWPGEVILLRGIISPDADVLAIVDTELNDEHIGIAIKKQLTPAFRVADPIPAKVSVSKFLYDYGLQTFAILAKDIWGMADVGGDLCMCNYGTGTSEVVEKTDKLPVEFSSGDMVIIRLTDCDVGLPGDHWIFNGTLILECLSINESSSTVRVFGERFQDSDEDEKNIYYDFDTKTQHYFATQETFHTIEKIRYEADSPVPLRIRYQTIDPIVRILYSGNGYDYGPVVSGELRITGSNNSSISVTFPGGGWDNPVSLLVDEDGDGNSEGTIQTTLEDLKIFD